MDRFLERPKGVPAADKTGKATAASVEPPADTPIQPWVEKHRPRTMEDVCAQDHTVRVLERSMTNVSLSYSCPSHIYSQRL